MDLAALKSKMVKGGTFVALGRVLFNVSRFVRILILAKFLAPGDFGLFGVCLLLRSFLDILSQAGLRVALIQRSGHIAQYLNAVWTFNICRGFVTCGLIVCIAPLLNRFFGLTPPPYLFLVVGLGEVVKGFTNVGVIDLEKRLDFKPLSFLNVASELLALVMGIILAWQLRNVWALVGGTFAGTAALVTLSFVVSRYRPSLEFSLTKIRILFRFGRWIMGSNLLSYSLNQVDNIIVGRMFGQSALGVYVMAYELARKPVSEVSAIFTRVLFPAMSKLQNSTEKLRQVYLRCTFFVTLITFPLATAIALLADDILGVLGKQWSEAVPIVRIFCLLAAVISVGSITANTFVAMGQPRITTLTQSTRLVLLVILALPWGAAHGLLGVAAATLTSELLTISYLLHRVCRDLEIRLQSVFVVLSQSVLASMGMVLIWQGSAFAANWSHWTRVAVAAPLCGLTYVVMLLALDRFYRQQPAQLLQKVISSQG